MQLRNDLYLREDGRKQIAGDGPVDLWMRQGMKCGAKTTRARELADGRVVCLGCKHGPCLVPDGIGRDRELRVHKDK